MFAASGGDDVRAHHVLREGEWAARHVGGGDGVDAWPQMTLWGRQRLDWRPGSEVQSGERCRVKILDVWLRGNRQSVPLASGCHPFVYPSASFMYVSGHPATLWGRSGTYVEDCPYKVVRTNGSDEVLARAANLLIGRAAFETRPDAFGPMPDCLSEGAPSQLYGVEMRPLARRKLS
jgi:hypothetical protein